MLFGACSSMTHWAAWPSAPGTSTVNRQCGLDHNQSLTTPFSVEVVSSKSVEPLWWARRGTPVHSATATPTTIINLVFIGVPMACRPGLLAAGRVAEPCVVSLDFSGRTVARDLIDPRILQRHGQPHRLPRTRVDFRIVNGLGPLHRLGVDPAETFGDPRLLADWPAGVVEPHAVVRHGADGDDFERVIVDPPADRVPERPRIAVLAVDFDAAVHERGQRAAISPDDPPAAVIVVGHHDLVFVLEDLDAKIVMVPPGEPQRLAPRPRIVVESGRHGVDALERLVGAVKLQAVRCVRKRILGAAVIWLQLHAARLVAQPQRIPHAGDVPSRRRFPLFHGVLPPDCHLRRPQRTRFVLRDALGGREQYRTQQAGRQHHHAIQHRSSLENRYLAGAFYPEVCTRSDTLRERPL